MRAIDWIQAAERVCGNGKRQFARQKLIDALETMSDQDINDLCGDIIQQRGEPAGNSLPHTQLSDNSGSSPENKAI